jgi:predicted phosphoribosyltransferase
MIFKNRRQAGELLAEKLSRYRDKEPLILSVPRGGVIVAEPVWDYLGGRLDLIISRKISSPYQPELAIGAVTAAGFLLLNDILIRQQGISPEYIERAAESGRLEIQRRLTLYRGENKPPILNDRIVLVVDDGVATGFTIKAALRSVRRHKPAELVLAVPVGPPETLAVLRLEVDQLYCLESPAIFSAVGQFYGDFSQVDDTEVIRIMHRVFNCS